MTKINMLKGGLILSLILSVLVIWSAVAEEKFDNATSPFTTQLNKPVICGNIDEVDEYYLSLGFVPVIRANSVINFKIKVYLKETAPKSGKITDIVILEINPTNVIACVAYAGKSVEFNSNFWDEFNATIIYLDPEAGLSI